MSMSREEVTTLMLSSESERDWDDKCDQVKAAFGGDYPRFWFEDVIRSGLAQRALAPKPVPVPGPPDRPSPLSEQGPELTY